MFWHVFFASICTIFTISHNDCKKNPPKTMQTVKNYALIESTAPSYPPSAGVYPDVIVYKDPSVKAWADQIAINTTLDKYNGKNHRPTLKHIHRLIHSTVGQCSTPDRLAWLSGCEQRSGEALNPAGPFCVCRALPRVTNSHLNVLHLSSHRFF